MNPTDIDITGDSDPAISVRGLRKSNGKSVAVDGLDLDVRRGEVFSLPGPNGAGRTATVEILEGYRSRDEGSVELVTAGRSTSARRRRDPPAADLRQAQRR